MFVPCKCGAYNIDPEFANYVSEGKPMCHPETCAKVRQRRVQQVPLASREECNGSA